MQPRPTTDYDRLARVVEDIAATMHFSSVTAELQARIEGWVHKVVATLYRRGPWWFLENAAAAEIPEYADIVDLCGHIGLVREVYCPKRLMPTPFRRIVELRANAVADAMQNGGTPALYAIESGFRVHLWPAPVADTEFTVLYDRPPDVALFPLDWDGILVDGAIGLFGRHFDKSGLVEDPREFEQRFWRELRHARASHSPEMSVSSPFICATDMATSQVTARSSVPRPVTWVAPISLEGSPGYVSLPLPDYSECPLDDHSDAGVIDPCAKAARYYSDGWSYDGTVEYVDASGCEGAGPEAEQCEALLYNGWPYDGTVEYIACGSYEAPTPTDTETPTPAPPPLEVDIPVVEPAYQIEDDALYVGTGSEIPLPFGVLLDQTQPWAIEVTVQMNHPGASTPIWGTTDTSGAAQFQVDYNCRRGQPGTLQLRMGGTSLGSVNIEDNLQTEEPHRLRFACDPVAGTTKLTVHKDRAGITRTYPYSLTPAQLAAWVMADYLYPHQYKGLGGYNFVLFDVRLYQNDEEVAWYPLDEGTGTGTGDVLHDRTGGNDITIADFGTSEWWGTRPYVGDNLELFFDGANTRIDIPFGPLGLSAAKKWYIYMDVRPYSTDQYPLLRTVGTTGADAHHLLYRIIPGAATPLHLEVAASSIDETPTTNAPSAGVLRHEALSQQISPNFHAFGHNEDPWSATTIVATSFNVGAAVYAAWTSQGTLSIGFDPSLAVGLKGKLRDIRIFQGQTPDVDREQIAYYPLDDAVSEPGATIQDRSGNGHHGTLVAIGGGLWQPCE